MFFDKKVLGRKVEQPKIIKDHLGNIRVTIDESGDVVSADDYYPFGMQMPGRSYNVAFSGNQYKFGSKELDDENGLNWYDNGARLYDPEVARWHVVDPLTSALPASSPYVYALNNPIIFIDPDGAFPYNFNVRAFAPSGAFTGFGYHDDGRGFSTSQNVTSRISHSFTVDPSGQTMSKWRPVSGVTTNSQGETKQGVPSGDVGAVFNGEGSARVDQFFEGSNPFYYGVAPDIKVSSQFNITEDLDAGTLSISAVGESKQFPATEAFLSDSKGNSVFLGVGAAYGDPTDLIFSGEEEIFNNTIIININDEGVFQNVTYNGNTYSIQEFNDLWKNQGAGPYNR